MRKVLALVGLVVILAVAVSAAEEVEYRFPTLLGADGPIPEVPKDIETLNFMPEDFDRVIDSVITMDPVTGEAVSTPIEAWEGRNETRRAPLLSEPVRKAVGLSALPYSDAAAKQFARYSAAAYCVNRGPAALRAWTCTACKESAKLTEITTISRLDLNIHVYVGYLASSKTIIVSFAGTEMTSIVNWITNLVFKHVDYSYCASAGCQVHFGFLNAYSSVRSGVVNAVNALRAKYPGAITSVTGHSLGGAMGELCAFDLFKNGIPLAAPMYNFGTPRVGNAAFARTFNSLFGNRGFYRLVHFKDPVPQVPLVGWDFEHMPQEIYCQAQESSCKTCSGSSGEDKTCSYKTTLPNLFDAGYHMQYGKFDYGAAKC